MAVPFLNSITLNKNEVQDFKVYNIGTGNPTLSSGGDIGYFWTDTTGSASARVLKWWDGSNVRTLLDSSSTTVVAADLSGGAAGSLPYQLTAGDTVFLGIGTADQVLKVNSGATAPEWVNQSSLSVGSATNKPGGTLGDILVQSGSGTTTFLNVGTVGQVLTSNGASPAYVNQSSLSVGAATTATTATNVAGGAAGELLYQSGLATTAKLGVGTDGYILTYDGTNTKPKWSASIPAGSVSGLAASATTDTTNAANISSGLLPLARLALATGQFYVGDASNNPAATAKSSISLTGFGALTADLDIAGFNIINSGNVTSGSSGSTLATKGYVDSVAQGLDIKASCLVASTADINLSAPGSGLIDGIDPATFTSGTTRILVKDQSLSQQNGIYIWNGTGSAMTRSLDANTWDELVGAFTFIETGTANADSGWVCTANAGGTLGTTPVPFVKFSQAGSYTAGNGMVLSGGVFHFAQSAAYTAGRIPFASSTSAIGFNANLFWDNTNSRLGIGTATPSVSLDVNGSAYFRDSSAIVGAGKTLEFISTYPNRTQLYQTAGNNFTLDNISSGGFLFYTNSNLRATLDSSGNLGLGVTPAYRFHVYSLVNNETRFQTASTTAGHTNRLSFSVPTGTADTRSGAIEWYDLNTFKGDIRFLKAGGLQIRNSADSPTVTLDDSGNLSNVGYHKAGLFTVSAGGLSAFDAASGGLYNYYSSGGVIAAYSDNSGTLASLTLDASSFVFRTAGTTKLTLNNSGVLLLKTNGTASAPTIANADNPDTGLYWPTDNDTLALAVGGSDAVYIDSSRNVIVGGSSPINSSAGRGNITINGTSSILNFAISNTEGGYLFHDGTNMSQVVRTNGYLAFSTNNVECLRIKSTGQLNLVGLNSAPTGAVGDLYYNSTSNTLQYHNNSAFQQLSRKFSGALSGTGTSFTVTHNLGTRDVTVQVRKSGSTYDLVYTDVQMTTTDTVTVIFASSVTGSDYTVTVIG